MKKKRLTAKQRRISIIEATMRVVARLNYDRATTALIAKEAGVNQALIYNHFESKLELQLAMLRHIRDTLLDRYESNPEVKQPSPQYSILESVTNQYHSNLKDEVLMRSCVIKAMIAIDQHIREMAWEVIKTDHEFIRRCLSLDQERGIYEQELDVELTAWWISAADLLLSNLSLMGKLDIIPRERIIESLKYLEKGFKKTKTGDTHE